MVQSDKKVRPAYVLQKIGGNLIIKSDVFLTFLMLFSYFLFFSSSTHIFCFASEELKSQCTLENFTAITEISQVYECFIDPSSEIIIEFIPEYTENCNLDLSEAVKKQWEGKLTIIGRTKNPITVYVPNETVQIASFSFSNMSITFTSAGGNSQIRSSNTVTLLDCDIIGSTRIVANHLNIDLLTLYKMPSISPYEVTIYQLNDDQMLPPNTTFEFEPMDSSMIAIYGFSQKTYVLQTDKSTSFTFTSSDNSNTAQFIIIGATVSIYKTAFPSLSFRLKRDNIAIYKYTEVYVENGCEIQIIDPDPMNTNCLTLHSMSGGKMVLMENTNVGQIIVENCNVTLETESGSYTINMLTAVNSIISLPHIVTNQFRINSLTLTFRSYLESSDYFTLNIQTLQLYHQKDVKIFGSFYIQNLLEVTNSSVSADTIHFGANCKVKVYWEDQPVTGIKFTNADNIPNSLTLIKNGANATAFVNRSSYFFCSPNLVCDDISSFDLSENDVNKYGFTTKTSLLRRVCDYVGENKCIGAQLYEDPQEAYPAVCFTNDYCEIEGVMTNLVKPGDSLSFLTSRTRVVRIFSNTTITEENPITLDEIKYPVGVEIGHSNFQFPIALKITPETPKHIYTLTIADTNFTILIPESVDLNIQNFTITPTATFAYHQFENLNIGNLKYLRIPIELYMTFDLLLPQQVDLIMVHQHATNLQIYKDFFMIQTEGVITYRIPIKSPNNINVSFSSILEGCIVSKLSENITTFNIIEETPFLDFDESWRDFHQIGVVLWSSYVGKSISTRTNVLPVQLKTATDLTVIKTNKNEHKIVTMPGQNIESLIIRLLSLSSTSFNLVILNGVWIRDTEITMINFDTTHNNTLTLRDSLFILSNNIKLHNLTIAGELSLDSKTEINVDFCNFDNAVIKTQAIAGERCGYLDSSSSTGEVTDINIMWELSDNFKAPPFNIKTAVFGSDTNITDQTKINFAPETCDIENGYVTTAHSLEGNSIYLQFDAVQTSTPRSLDGTLIVALVVACIVGVIAIILIVYTCLATQKRKF